MWVEGQLLQSDKYEIKRQIGRGGFGLTYLATDRFLQRQVVVKAPNKLCQNDRDYEKFVRRFQREGQVLAKIFHPNVVQVIEFFREAGMPCLVMAYVEGETLDQRIRNQGRLPQERAVSIFWKLAEALHLLHQTGLIHCDVHPGNIILRPDGEPVLIDFGSAKLLQPTTFTVTTTVNESFAPYEQTKRGSKPQATLDVYGLSATFYFAVTGEKPQSAMGRKMFGDSLDPPRQHCEELSDWLNQAILEGMALEARDRPSSMQAWLELFQIPQSIQSNVRRGEFREDLGDGVSLEMVLIPTGQFLMGSPDDEVGHYSAEGPQHQVSVSAFFMGRFPITQAQYQAVMGKNPSHFSENGASR
ncbi:MAG: protein kinase, partial [Leptolyngbya sp. SIO4C5]|nr:protein kinase [Leptolyngbya sp. SIO4C5]